MTRHRHSSVALPAEAIPIGTYADLDRYLNAFADGALQLILLLGRPGTGKTQRVKDAIRRSELLGQAARRSAVNERIGRALYIDGYVSPFSLYRQLWLHRNGQVVIDDLDKLYAQSECLHLLKQLCNCGPVRQLSWHNRMTDHSVETPALFETTSTVMLIANEWRTLNADVRALEDRALVMHFDPPNHEVHAEVGRWFHDEEVYDFIGSFLPCVPRLSIRHYLKGRAIRRARFADWRKTLMRMLLPDQTLAAVARLQADGSFDSEKDRIKQFIAETGRSRPTYFRLKKCLLGK